MLLSGTDTLDSMAQFMTVLLIFAFVLAITYFTTRWIANFQKKRAFGQNIESIEAYRLTTNKYIQIVKVGEKYLVLAVCKDTVTMLTELNEDQIELNEKKEPVQINFKEILEKAKNLKSKD
jgi:flagellar protein FliO/FliZ